MTIHFVIPFHGSLELFKEAYESVLLQNDNRWKLTVINDDPNKQPEISEIVDTSPGKIEIVVNPSNLGIAANFNKAISISDGKYIVILGSDDRLKNNYVSRIHRLLELFPNANIIQPGVQVIDGVGNLHLPLADRVKQKLSPKGLLPKSLSGERIASSIAIGCWTYFPSLCFETSFVSKHSFNEKYGISLDLIFIEELLISGAKLVVDDVPVFEYRRHNNSASMSAQKLPQRFTEERTAYKELEQKFQNLKWDKARKAAKYRLTSRVNLFIFMLTSMGELNFKQTSKLWRLFID